eukprot:gnl/MRDRNA2_/MRDRNA2_79696_c1_seq2.p1 gnl/MRDRNA2_/MRDRNA2_79696_c1~~gnl/MRDRNA2_/MRDRNA2_79696_c1_seq2.p1  ORF type:complete len:691 (+),score=232.34 gnl/MRDRNA2_/MRDRNA2_79696_c1_seq2:80-2152(+)
MFHSVHFCLAFALVGQCSAAGVSPVMKVVELLDECKAKVEKDLAAEAAAMEEYTTFCTDTLEDKGYAIDTAEREILGLDATVESSNAEVAALADEISTLGSTMAAKSAELYDATKVREEQAADFKSAESELLVSIDQLGRAATILKRGMSFAQGQARVKKMKEVVDALKSVIEAAWVDVSSKKKLHSFLQARAAAAEDDDLSFSQPQAKMVAYSSSSGAILDTIKDMQGKAEDTLSTMRKKETSDAHTFGMLKGGLEAELSHGADKLSIAKKAKAAGEEASATAQKKSTDTKKSKAADESYSKTLKTECETTAAGWAAREKSAKEEVAAIEKAKSILVSGVKAFVQVGIKTKVRRNWSPDDEDDDDKTAARRSKVVAVLTKLADHHHSFALAQVASIARSDPFVKVRGLIESMIAKLLKEAQEEATREAFCQEEMGKSTKSKEDKTMTLDKLNTRIDGASSTIAQLEEDIKSLDTEIAEIDSATKEATALRAKEHADYTKASKDFKESAEAVAKAIEVLKNFYSGSLLQVSSKTTSKSLQPAFGAAKSDTASTIISVLEMAEEDFTTLLAETESEEDEAATAFETLSEDNKVSKAEKLAEAKGKASEVKSLKVQLGHHEEDKTSVTSELAAVNSYLDKLKPECESKAMSYAEKKAAREAEIAGLKEALSILEGSTVFAQTGHYLRAIRRA